MYSDFIKKVRVNITENSWSNIINIDQPEVMPSGDVVQNIYIRNIGQPIFTISYDTTTKVYSIENELDVENLRGLDTSDVDEAASYILNGIEEKSNLIEELLSLDSNGEL